MARPVTGRMAEPLILRDNLFDAGRLQKLSLAERRSGDRIAEPMPARRPRDAPVAVGKNHLDVIATMGSRAELQPLR